MNPCEMGCNNNPLHYPGRILAKTQSSNQTNVIIADALTGNFLGTWLPYMKLKETISWYFRNSPTTAYNMYTAALCSRAVVAKLRLAAGLPFC